MQKVSQEMRYGCFEEKVVVYQELIKDTEKTDMTEVSNPNFDFFTSAYRGEL